MNKLTISEGGQPVVLEDFLLLQENAHAMIGNVLALLMNGATSFLASKPTNILRYKDENKEVRRVGASVLYFEGYMYNLQNTEIELEEGSNIYVCVKHEKTDVRRFEDLQDRACRESLVGYYSNTSEGAHKAWLLSELPIWSNMGGSNGTSGNIPVNWVNEFSGALSSIASRVNRVFTLNISSASSNWSDVNEDGALGTFVVDDSSDYGFLIGKRTPAFVSGSRSLYLEFTSDGVILLREVSVSERPLFLSNIDFEWALTDMSLI